MTGLRDWLEEHWLVVGVVAPIAGALAFAVILAVFFNVLTTRHERLRSEAIPEVPSISAVGSRPGATPAPAGDAGPVAVITT